MLILFPPASTCTIQLPNPLLFSTLGDSGDHCYLPSFASALILSLTCSRSLFYLFSFQMLVPYPPVLWKTKEWGSAACHLFCKNWTDENCLDSQQKKIVWYGHGRHMFYLTTALWSYQGVALNLPLITSVFFFCCNSIVSFQHTNVYTKMPRFSMQIKIGLQI